MVHLDGVVRRFDSLTAVDGVTFDVHRGEIFGLLGHNGAGKTTLIRLITGLLQSHAGTIRTLDLDPIAQGERVRAGTGVLTEYPALDHFLTPVENLAVYASIHGVDPVTAQQRQERLLARLGLENHRDLPAHGLSAGLKQRVALARALVHDPELLLLDEPTSNLDPLAARGVRDLVRELAREDGRTVMLSTHNLQEAQQLCDRIAIIRQGRLLACGALDELRSAVTIGALELVVGTGQAGIAAASLAALPGVEVHDLGDGHTLEVRCATDDVPRIVHEVVTAGVEVHAVRPEAPTLEDVYVSLHATDGWDAPDATGVEVAP